MTLTIREQQDKLMKEILAANMQEEVKSLIDEAMQSLQQSHRHIYVSIGFIEKMMNGLQDFDPMNQTAQQWSNIKMARVHFNQIKKHDQPDISY